MTCEQHADSTSLRLLETPALKIEEADFFGDSFGGAIAVMMAVRHPRLVRRVVSYGEPACSPSRRSTAAVIKPRF
jgi:pimeloyl-ACP methyl ester carboxylesterase